MEDDGLLPRPVVSNPTRSTRTSSFRDAAGPRTWSPFSIKRGQGEGRAILAAVDVVLPMRDEVLRMFASRHCSVKFSCEVCPIAIHLDAAPPHQCGYSCRYKLVRQVNRVVAPRLESITGVQVLPYTAGRRRRSAAVMPAVHLVLSRILRSRFTEVASPFEST